VKSGVVPLFTCLRHRLASDESRRFASLRIFMFARCLALPWGWSSDLASFRRDVESESARESLNAMLQQSRKHEYFSSD
jgi:hypothetical protein